MRDAASKPVPLMISPRYDGKSHAILDLVVGGAGLGELTRDAADFDDRLRAGESQHDRHLQEHAEEVADIVRTMLGEALGAVATLEQESLAIGDAGQLLLQLARLTCKNQRRKGRKTRLGLRQHCLVRVDRHLADGLRSPRIR